MTAWEHVCPVPVVGKRARFAHQPVNNMPAMNLVFSTPTPTQPRQRINPSLGIPYFQMVNTQAHLNFFTNQPAVHRIGIIQNMDRTAGCCGFFDRRVIFEFTRWQSLQNGQLFLQALLPSGILLPQK